jgi:hypothetical protein
MPTIAKVLFVARCDGCGGSILGYGTGELLGVGHPNPTCATFRAMQDDLRALAPEPRQAWFTQEAAAYAKAYPGDVGHQVEIQADADAASGPFDAKVKQALLQ